MKIIRTSGLLAGMVAFLLAACNKGEDNLLYSQQAMSVTLRGYNASTEQLTVKVDTFNSKQIINPGSFSLSEAFLFKGNLQAMKLSIGEKGTGKPLLEKELKKEEGPFNLSFLYMDGKVSDMPEKPALANEKISLTYMFIPDVTNYSEPVDFVVGKYFVTPKVFEELARIKNVKPNEFSESATISTFSTARQDYNGVMTSVSFQVRICKAGTNTPYTEGTAYTWNELSTTAPKPTGASTAASKLYIFSETPSGTLMRFGIRLDY